MSSASDRSPAGASRSGALTEPAWVRRLAISVSVLFVAAFLLVPLVAVFSEALR